MPSAPRPAPRPILVIAAVLAAFAAAILLSGPLHGALASFFPAIPFAKVFRYLLLALLLGVLVVAAAPWRDFDKATLYGLRGPRSRPRLVFVGFAIAVALLATIAGLDALLGHLRFDEAQGWRKFKARLPAVIGGAIVLGLVEEIFFRGWLFERVRTRLSTPATALLLSLVFGGLHAFRASDAPRDLVAGPAAAVSTMGAWARNLVDLRDFGPSFLALVLLSLVLTAAYLRFRTLWFGVGFHGGASMFMNLNSALTDRDVERNWLGSKWLYDGVVGWVLLAVLLVVLWPRAARIAPARPPPPPESSP